MALLPKRRTSDEERGWLFPELWSSPFGDFWRALDLSGWREGQLTPTINVAETDDAVTVTAELPGVTPAEIEVTVEGDVLTIHGEKNEEKEEKGKSYHRIERRYGSFSRSIHLPSSVQSDKVKASSKDGVLTVEIPKREDAKPKKIKIDVK
ncbi:MAG: Hsp20/alpha crystallin family protein [Planctomycetota bacterium]